MLQATFQFRLFKEFLGSLSRPPAPTQTLGKVLNISYTLLRPSDVELAMRCIQKKSVKTRYTLFCKQKISRHIEGCLYNWLLYQTGGIGHDFAKLQDLNAKVKC